jgi:predicted MFS family arabinose efflux permease
LRQEGGALRHRPPSARLLAASTARGPPSLTAHAAPSPPPCAQPQPDDDTSAKPSADEGESVHFWDAWAIPGVASFALCLFFSKLIAYTFLYWLPFYIKSTPIQGKMLSARQAGDLSTLFDVGGVAGGILAGHLSDKTGASALVATCFTAACVPALWLYRAFGHTSLATNVVLMMACGFLVNGPYALITTAVSADLGTHESLNGNAKVGGSGEGAGGLPRRRGGPAAAWRLGGRPLAQLCAAPL